MDPLFRALAFIFGIILLLPGMCGVLFGLLGTKVDTGLLGLGLILVIVAFGLFALVGRHPKPKRNKQEQSNFEATVLKWLLITAALAVVIVACVLALSWKSRLGPA